MGPSLGCLFGFVMPAISLYDPRDEGGGICGNTLENSNLGLFHTGTLGIW